MSNISNLLRIDLKARLPFLMMILVGLGAVAFAIAVVIPQWNIHEAAASDVADGSTAIAATLAYQSSSDSVIILQQQIQNVQTDMSKSGNAFLAQSEVDDLLHRVYDYANTSGAKIANLQAQQPAVQNVASSKDKPVYELRDVHLQVTGSVFQLMNFVIGLREASTPGVSINGLNVTRNSGQYVLTMTLSIRTSPYATGNALTSLTQIAPPAIIAVIPTVTSPPIPTPTYTLTPLPTSTPTSTPTVPVTPLADQCVQSSTEMLAELHFSQVQHGSTMCDIQIWNLKLAKPTKLVMDIVRKSGSGEFRMELHDSADKIVVQSLSSIDGRGILVADGEAGSYTLNIIPLVATGTWAYDIGIWPGLPALSFQWAQNSYSSHTTIDSKTNVMTWSYTLTGATQNYQIQTVRTDGDLEYNISVVDSAGKEVALVKSDSGNITVPLSSGAGTYLVHMTTVDGTSGSYRIALIH